MNTSKRLSAMLGGIFLAACVLAHADPVKVISLEYAVEASTDIAILPTSSTSSVTMTCDSCGSRTYRVTADTKYFIGQTSVSLADVTDFVRGRAAVGFTFFITKDGSAVTRIVMSAASARAAPNATTRQPRAR